MRILGAVFLSLALIPWCAPAPAAEALAEKGAAKFATYQVCHPLAVLDMDAAGSESSTECNGIVKNLDAQSSPDNLSIRCLEDGSTRTDGHTYAGTCVQTDGDGDKIFMTYSGSKASQIKWIGGTGKFAGVEGVGGLNVVVAPGATPHLFAYTFSYDVAWTRKSK